MRYIGILACCLLLTACGDDLRAGMHRLSNEIQNKHDPDNRLQAATRYCYRAASDTLCYTRPQPDMEDRLIGYQEPLEPAGQVYERATKMPSHYDAAMRDEAPGTLTTVNIKEPPAVKGAQPVDYDASALDPKPLMAGP
jgi:hypothetical protein